MTSPSPVDPTQTPRSKHVVAIVGVAGAAVLVFGALIAREIFAHHAPAHAPVATDDAAAAVETHDEPAPAPVAKLDTPSVPTVAPRPSPTPAGSADDAALAQAGVLASLVRNPKSRPAEGVFHDRLTGIDQYSYEGFGPFRRGELKRDSKNADAWEIDGSNGPGHETKIEDVAPPGGFRAAATVRDDKGTVVGTWYAIEAGPLAPAYATLLAVGGTRIVSREYLETHRAQFPSSLTTLLDH